MNVKFKTVEKTIFLTLYHSGCLHHTNHVWGSVKAMFRKARRHHRYSYPAWMVWTLGQLMIHKQRIYIPVSCCRLSRKCFWERGPALNRVLSFLLPPFSFLILFLWQLALVMTVLHVWIAQTLPFTLGHLKMDIRYITNASGPVLQVHNIEDDESGTVQKIQEVPSTCRNVSH